MKKLPYLAAALAALVLPTAAFAHARVSPPVWLAKQLQLYSLAVPTEKENAMTTKIVLTVPSGLLDRLVRAEPRLAACAAADRVGGERRGPEGDVDGRRRPDGGRLALPVPRRAVVERDEHVPGGNRPTRTARSSTGRARSRPNRRPRRSRRSRRSAPAALRSLTIIAIVARGARCHPRSGSAVHARRRETGTRVTQRGRGVVVAALVALALILPGVASAHATGEGRCRRRARTSTLRPRSSP